MIRKLFTFTIRTKIILGFVLTLTLLLVMYSVFVLYMYETNRKTSYLNRLSDNAFYITQQIVEDINNHRQLNTIFIPTNANKFRLTPSQAFIVLDQKNDTVFKHNEAYIPKQNPNFIRRMKQISRIHNDTQFVAFELQINKKHYLVMATGYNDIGIERYNYLRRITIIYILISIVLISIIAVLFSGYIINPIRSILQTISAITDKNLHTRLRSTDKNDEVDQLSQTFNRMLDRIESSFQLEKKFVAHAAHEYRTPLTTIKGQIEVALMKERTAAYYTSLLHSINDDIDRLVGLQRALSDLMKVSVRNVQTDFRYIPFVEIIAESRDLVLQAHKNYHIYLRVEEYPEDPELSVVHGDHYLLRSAISNLLDNGCKYSANNTCFVTVSFSNGYIHTHIEDHGHGIAEEELQYIFDPFFRSTQHQTLAQGYGIGLSLVKRIIEIHKAEITVTSVVDKGSVFKLMIPSIKVNA